MVAIAYCRMWLYPVDPTLIKTLKEPCQLGQQLETTLLREKESKRFIGVEASILESTTTSFNYDLAGPSVMAINSSLSALSSTNDRRRPPFFFSSSLGVSNSTSRPESNTMILSASMIVRSL